MLERAFISQHVHVVHTSLYSPQISLKSDWAVRGENMLHQRLFWILQTLFLFGSLKVADKWKTLQDEVETGEREKGRDWLIKAGRASNLQN